MQNLEKLMPRRKPRKKVYNMEIDEADMESGVQAISLVEEPAIEADWIYLSKQKNVDLAQVAPDKRILMGPVLIPNKLIPRIDEVTGEEYDINFTPETIEKAAHLYLQRQMNNNATIEHESGVDDISTVESWIIVDPEKDKSVKFGMKYPKGTWMVAMKVNNPTIWNDYVKTGKVKGFSIEGMLGHTLVKASKIELGYNTTGYDQQTQTRGLAVPPPTYGGMTEGTQPPPFALKPGFDGGEFSVNASNYDGIWLEKIMKLIEESYTGDNEEEVITLLKQMLQTEMGWAEFETAVSIGSSYAGQFGDTKKTK